MERLFKTNLVPFAVAVQATLLIVASFFILPSVTSDSMRSGVGSDGRAAPESLTSISELPRDLRRERLPVPEIPEREAPDAPKAPAPDDSGPESNNAVGELLAGLRTEELALHSPIAVAISAPMLGAPDNLDGLSLADGGWLGRRPRGRSGGGRASGPSDVGGGGNGGRGIGGFGSGTGGGGYCPTPGRIGGGGGRGGGPVAVGSPGRPGPGGTGRTGTPTGGTRGRPAEGGERGGKGKGKGGKS